MTPEELCSDGLLSVKDAAKFLGVSRSKFYELIDSGLLPFAQFMGEIRARHAKRIPKRALIEFAARSLVKAERFTNGTSNANRRPGT